MVAPVHTIEVDASGSGTSPMTTVAIDSTGVKNFVVFLGVQNSGEFVSFTDNKGNTWNGHPSGQQPYAGGGGYCYSLESHGALTVGPGHTFTLTKAGGYETGEATIMVQGFTDTDGNAPLQWTFSTASDYSGSITPTAAGNKLASGWLAADYTGGASTYSVGGSTPTWGLLDQWGNSSSYNSGAHAWKEATGTTADPITYASTGGGISTGSAMYMVEFAAGGAPPQEAYPAADVTDGAWTPSTGTDLFAVLDDASDADYITTNSNTIGEVQLASLSTPVAGTQTLAFRASGSPAKRLIASVIEGLGGPVRGTLTVDPLTAVADYSFTLSGVTAYSDLRTTYQIADATTPPTPSVSFGAIGTGANGSTSVVVPVPAGIVAGNYLTIEISSGATNSETPSTPAGWTLLATDASTDGTFGVDTGPRRSTVFGKVAVGGETSVTVTITNGNTARGTMTRWVLGHAGYSWDVVAQGANDSTSGTGVSMTTAAISWAVGDCASVVVGQRVDTATQSAQSLTAAGITFGARTNRATTAVTTGNDLRHVVDTFAAVTAGAASVATTWAYTASAAVSAGGVIVRLREVPPTEFGRVYTTKLTIPAAAGGGGTVHTVGVTEAMAVADALSVLAAMGVSAVEAAALVSAQTGLTVTVVATAESASLADSVSGGLLSAVSAAEPAALTDTAGMAYATAGAVTEAATLAATQAAVQATSASVAEPASLADSSGMAQATTASVTEAAALASAQTIAQATAASVTEAAALTTTQDTAASAIAVDQTDAVSLASVQSAAQATSTSVTEPATLADSQSVAQATTASTTEASALDSTQSGTTATSTSITEAVTLTDTPTAGLLSQVSLTEAAALASSADAAALLTVTLLEIASLQSSQSVLAAMGVTQADALALADTVGTGAGLLYAVNITEAASLASATTAVAAYIVSALDAAALGDSVSASRVTAVTQVDALGLIDSVSLGAQILALTQSDALSLNSSADVLRALAATTSEALALAAQETATLAGAVLVVESLSLDTAQSAGAVSVMTITEATTLADLVRWVSSLSADPAFTASADPLNRTAVAGVRVLIAKAMPGNFIAKWRK
jgi:trimeric autotransporter adhesin